MRPRHTADPELAISGGCPTFAKSVTPRRPIKVVVGILFLSGTHPGASELAREPVAQNFGPERLGGRAVGRVRESFGVPLERLTGALAQSRAEGGRECE